MTTEARLHTLDLSRRSFLRNAATIAGAAAAMAALAAPTTASAGLKFSQTMAKYQPLPKGAQDCANCSLFEPSSSCKIVDGKIAVQGWCQLYSPKAR